MVNIQNPIQMAAMKTEPIGMLSDDQILKMEVHVLKKLKKSQHACKIYAAGKVNIDRQKQNSLKFFNLFSKKKITSFFKLIIDTIYSLNLKFPADSAFVYEVVTLIYSLYVQLTTWNLNKNYFSGEFSFTVFFEQ